MLAPPPIRSTCQDDYSFCSPACAMTICCDSSDVVIFYLIVINLISVVIRLVY